MENYYEYLARDDFYSDQEDLKKTYEAFKKSLDIDYSVFGDEHKKDNLSEAEKAEAKQQLRDAYETLSNPQKKQQYDLDLLSEKHPEGFDSTLGYYVPGENFIHLNPEFFKDQEPIRKFSIPSHERTGTPNKTPLVDNRPINSPSPFTPRSVEKVSTSVTQPRTSTIASTPSQAPMSNRDTINRLYPDPVKMGENHDRSKRVRNSIIGIVVLAALFLWMSSGNSSKTNSNSSNNTHGNDYSNTTNQVSDSELQEVKVENGEIIVHPQGECLAPFTVETESSDKSNYFIYLKCLNNSKNDIAFYVQGGNTVEVAVPLGRYKLYYCSGKTWYGYYNKFGSKTSYSKADDVFEFYDDGQYYQGHIITLYEVVNGNMETDTIDGSQFPG